MSFLAGILAGPLGLYGCMAGSPPESPNAQQHQPEQSCTKPQRNNSMLQNSQSIEGICIPLKNPQSSLRWVKVHLVPRFSEPTE